MAKFSSESTPLGESGDDTGGGVMKLRDDLYLYLWEDPYENNCNSYVIAGEVTVLIDPGHSRHLESLFRRMEEEGLSSDAIDLIIPTHGHPDHLEGVILFLGKPVKWP